MGCILGSRVGLLVGYGVGYREGRRVGPEGIQVGFDRDAVGTIEGSGDRSSAFDTDKVESVVGSKVGF